MMVQSSVAYDSTQSDPAALRTFYNGYGCRPDGFMHDVAATSHSGGDFRGLYPSQFVCQPTGHFSNVFPPTLVNTYNDRNLYQAYSSQYRSGLPTAPCVPFSTLGQSRQWGGDREPSYGAPARTESDAAIQRKRDSQWVRCFSRNRTKPTNVPQKRKTILIKSDLKPILYRVAQLVTQLDTFCNTLRSNINDCDVWTDSYTEALNLKKELEEKLAVIDCEDFDAWKSKLRSNAERRTRKKQQDAEKRRQERISEKEAVIDAWRLRQIRGVEEKKKVTPVKKQNMTIYLYIHTYALVILMHRSRTLNFCISGTGAKARCRCCSL